VSGMTLDAREEEELYVILKPLEKGLVAPLVALLRKIEQALFQRLTIEELEHLAARFSGSR
jgi:hypothetical protein